MSAIVPWIYPVVAVLLAGIGGVLLVRGLFGRWFRAGGKRGRVRSCRRCRFDLSATDGHTCPECGHTARHEAEHYAGRFRWPVAALGLVLLLGAVGAGMTPGIQRDGWLHLLPMGVQVRVFHLEKNDQSFWRFTERLEGRNPAAASASGIQFSFHSSQVEPRVKEWRAAAFETAAKIYARNLPAGQSQAKRATTVFDRFARHGFAAEQIDRLIRLRGLQDRRVRVSLTSTDLTPTQEIRAARRALLTMPDDPVPVPGEHLDTVRMMLPRIIARANPDDADVHALAAYLAGSPDEFDHRSRGRNVSLDAPPQVWQAYSEFVTRGEIGCEDTLLQGIDFSEFVAAAAIARIADQPPEGRARCLERLSGSRVHGEDIFRDSFATLRSKIAWSCLEHADLSAFVLAEDRWFTAWAIGAVQSHPDRAERNALIALLGRSRFARPEAYRFATQTLWPDESIPLHLRIRPIMNLEGMPVDADDKSADFTPNWDYVLQRIADGDANALEAVDVVVNEQSFAPPSLAIAVARRLAATREDPQPWLADVARRIAGSQGHSATISGFAKVMDYRAGADPRRGRMPQELWTESAALKASLEARWPEP